MAKVTVYYAVVLDVPGNVDVDDYVKSFGEDSFDISMIDGSKLEWWVEDVWDKEDSDA